LGLSEQTLISVWAVRLSGDVANQAQQSHSDHLFERPKEAEQAAGSSAQSVG
jgi:hypothetical protein